MHIRSNPSHIYRVRDIVQYSRVQCIICLISHMQAIGFTLLDPDTIDSIPKFGTDLISEDYWLFLNSIVYHDEQEQDINISTLALNEGDSIGWYITRDGDWEIYINGKKRAVGWRNVPTDKPIWGVVEMYGKAITVQSEFCYGELYIL